MFYDGPPGLMVDLMKPSPNGVDLLYSDEYVAAKMARWNTNPYTYANNNPLKYVDPSGLKCEIAVHCWTVRRSGSAVGQHCGLSISDDVGDTTLDGSGGDVNQIELDNNYGTRGPYVSYPDSTCKCLRSYVTTFNAAQTPRTHIEGNSNWTLYCMVSHCGFSINWHGRQPPIGYKPEGACKRLDQRFLPENEGGGCVDVCVEWYKCP